MTAAAVKPLLSPVVPPAEDQRGQWWQGLFEASEDALLVCHRSGAVVDVNRKAWRLLGLQPGVDLPAQLLSSFLTPATARKLTELLARSSGRPETLGAVSLLCRGELSLVADLQVTPLAESYALVAVKDASRRWRMESHVQRLITAVNSTTDVIYLTDPDFRLTFVNSAFQQVTGHAVEEALGRDAGFLRVAADLPKMQGCRETAVRAGEWRGEFTNRRRDGTAYVVEAAISPIYDRNGGLLGYVSFERDITAQKRLQRELQLERDYTQSIIHSVDAAIYTVDCNLCLRHVNRTWQDLPPGYGWLAFPQPPQTGAPLLDYIADTEKRDQVREVLLRVLADGQPQELRGSLDAGRQWVVKITPWKHGDEVLGLNYFIVDQTKFCELQAQLFQAQKMETIGALAAGVAHDFNNLLLAVRGNVALLQLEDDLNAEVRKRLDQIEHAAARAADVTQQLLSFSRAGEEREIVLDFNQLAKETISLARRALKNKDRVELRLDLPEHPILVRMDSTRASQLLLNLAVNAADAMPEGGKLTFCNRAVALSPAQAQRVRLPGGTQFLCCRVSDTGTGIPPEVLPRIFDPFFTTKPKGKGTGLGLAIVHSIVTKAGGFIDVESVQGQGTTFSLHLPAVHERITQGPTPAPNQLVRGSGRVLIVDDMDFILDFTGAFLRAAGYEVLTALGPDEALAKLSEEQGRIDVLLTDHNMPGRSGVHLITEVRALWPRVQCILASGYLEEEELKRIKLDLGAPILHKPYNIREATDLVGRLCPAGRPG